MSLKAISVEKTSFDHDERLSLLGIMEEPMGYVAGQDMYQYVGSDPEGEVDPSGLMSEADALKWLKDNQATIKADVHGDCQAGLAALAAIYTELRRQNALGSLNSPAGYIKNGAAPPGQNPGTSYGPARIKAEFAEWAIANDKYGTFQNDFSGQETPEQFRSQVAFLILNHPAKIATSALRTFIDQWNDARNGDPNIADISSQPGILATLYNLGPNKSVPKANPQMGGSQIDGSHNFGQFAKEFAESQFAKDYMKDCGCKDGQGWNPPPLKPPIKQPVDASGGYNIWKWIEEERPDILMGG